MPPSRRSSVPAHRFCWNCLPHAILSTRFVGRLLPNDGILGDSSHLPVQQPYLVKLKVSIFISRILPSCTKPMSRLDSIASISKWLSAGTTTINTWAAVTTPRSCVRTTAGRFGHWRRQQLKLRALFCLQQSSCKPATFR